MAVFSIAVSETPARHTALRLCYPLFWPSLKCKWGSSQIPGLGRSARTFVGGVAIDPLDHRAGLQQASIRRTEVKKGRGAKGRRREDCGAGYYKDRMQFKLSRT